MGQNIKELTKIINICRKNGIISFKNADFEIRLSQQSFRLPITKRDIEIPIAGLPQQQESPSLSNLDLLLWSAGDTPNAQNNAL